MEHRPFGRTGIDVSAIGIGCWQVGGGYGDVEEDEFARAVGRALDLGINCFDTAEGYGMGSSERSLGRGARQPPRRGGHRHQVRHELQGQAELPRQQPRARLRVDRQEPQEPGHRPGRRLPRALARPGDPVRRDDGCARGGRARRQGPRRRALELQGRRDRSVQASVPGRRRPVRLEHVRPAHATRDPPLLRAARDRVHGVRLARVRAVDRNLHRGPGLRLGGLARGKGRWATSRCSSRSSAPSRSRGTSERSTR